MNRNSRSRMKRNAVLANKIANAKPLQDKAPKRKPSQPRKARNKHERLARALAIRASTFTLLSPAFGVVSHAADGRAYSRAADGSIRRLPGQDGAPKWKQRARTIRDFLTTIKEKAA